MNYLSLQTATHGAGQVTLTVSLMLVLVCLHRMKEGQKDIFYMAADSLDAASSAPFVERLVQRDFEVSSYKFLLPFSWGWAAIALGCHFRYHGYLIATGFGAHVESALAVPCLSSTQYCTAQQPCWADPRMAECTMQASCPQHK